MESLTNLAVAGGFMAALGALLALGFVNLLFEGGLLGQQFAQ